MGRYIFRQAEPVWAARLQKEMNIRMGFYAQVDKCKSSVNLACSTSYQIYVNGNFAAAGPARAAHGFYRVDEIDITSYLTKDKKRCRHHCMGILRKWVWYS
jgi:alpha-L-rhamnosidase